uniref:Arylsulfatase B-like n=1 Tax=Saccoglossus kowalevskii TaxID=10224 RepID=A0ABM0MYS3_SACKO|nr:PREDICTED: arylsulfatase B-like [Saccoglossus kowalevskii]
MRLTCLVLVALVCVIVVESDKQPHIVLILAEDLGWNAVGWHNPDLKMPILNQLAADGVIFNQSYVQPTCTPSRSALFTGYYPFKIQRQHQFLLNLEADGLSLDLKILPEMLKDVGWNLGFCKEEYLPNQRGFDSFYGSLTSGTSFYSKQTSELGLGYDFRDNTGVVQESDTYLPSMLAERAVDIVMGHYKEYPLFLEFSMALPGKALEVPQEYEDLYSDIENDRTRTLYAKFSAMDNSIGRLVDALKTRGMWDDTLFIFTSDNGAAASISGSNWPLRGTIGTLFEGCTRIPTFFHGSMLKKTGYVNNELIHIVDLQKTIIELAGAKTESDIDGMDMWKTISKGEPSPRTEFVYNIDDNELSPGAAIRVGDYKLITGNPNLVYPLRLLNSSADWWNYGDDPITRIPNSPLPPPANVTYLFNIIDDPEERNNLAEVYPNKVEELRHRLDEYRENLVPPVDRIIDPAGNPVNFGGVWSPGWC